MIIIDYIFTFTDVQLPIFWICVCQVCSAIYASVLQFTVVQYPAVRCNAMQCSESHWIWYATRHISECNALQWDVLYLRVEGCSFRLTSSVSICHAEGMYSKALPTTVSLFLWLATKALNLVPTFAKTGIFHISLKPAGTILLSRMNGHYVSLGWLPTANGFLMGMPQPSS